MDKEDSCDWFRTIVRFSQNVRICSTIHFGGLVLDSRVIGLEFVHHLDFAGKLKLYGLQEVVFQGRSGILVRFK
jgi:hypothetical protein